MRAFERLAETTKRHPWTVIAVCLLLTVVLGLGLLRLEGHVTYPSLLPPDFPSVRAINELNSEFGGISYEYVMLQAPSVTDNEVVEFLLGLGGELAEDPAFNRGQIETRVDQSGKRVPVVQDYLTPLAATIQREMAARGFDLPVGSIDSSMVQMFTGKDFKALIEQDYLSNPQAASQVVGRFITPDHKTALVMIKAGADLSESQQVQLGADLEKFFTSRVKLVPGLTVRLSGDPTLARDFNEHIKSKTAILFVIALLLVLATLFLAFRRASDTLLPLAVMLLGVLWTFGLTGWVNIDYTVGVIAVMPLLLGTSLTFVVPFVARYYEEMEGCRQSAEAVGKAMMGIGVGIFLAAVTNVFGFLVFRFSVLPALKDFGVTCAVGTVFISGLTVLLLPAVLLVRDRACEKGRLRFRRGEVERSFDGLAMRKNRGIFNRATNRALGFFARLSMQHSLALIIVFTVLILAGMVQIRGLTTDSDLRKLVPRDLPSMSADFEMEKYFGGHQQDVVMVSGDVLAPESLAAMAAVERAVTTGDGERLYTVRGATSLPDVLTAANNGRLPRTRQEAEAALETAEDNGGYVIGGLLSQDRGSALITLNASGAATPEIVDRKMELLNSASREHLPGAGLDFILGGITPLTKDMTKNIIPTETLSSILSLALCALVLVLIFRSFSYGLITLTVALAGVAAEIGFLNIVNWPLDIMTSLVSALVIGIGVNFGILFTHRYIQEKEASESSAAKAINATMSNLGRANVIAAVATIAAFLIVMYSGIVPLRRFGGVTAVAISACILTSLTLMPALLYRMSGHLEKGEEEPRPEPEPQPV